MQSDNWIWEKCLVITVTEVTVLSELLGASAEMLLFSADVVPAGPSPGWEVVKYVAACWDCSTAQLLWSAAAILRNKIVLGIQWLQGNFWLGFKIFPLNYVHKTAREVQEETWVGYGYLWDNLWMGITVQLHIWVGSPPNSWGKDNHDCHRSHTLLCGRCDDVHCANDSPPSAYAWC